MQARASARWSCLIERAAGAIIAGGRSKRFGSEKAAALLNGRALLEYAVAHLQASTADIVVIAPPGSGAAAIARAAGLAVARDAPGDPIGPLAGVKAALAWARERR